MKRYMLIDIPCVMLVLLSIFMLLYSIDGYHKFAVAEKGLEQLKPTVRPDALVEYIENLGKDDETLTMVADILKSNHKEIMMKSDFEVEIVGSLKNRYQQLIYFSSSFMVLTIFLSAGIARYFRNSSIETKMTDL